MYIIRFIASIHLKFIFNQFLYGKEWEVNNNENYQKILKRSRLWSIQRRIWRIRIELKTLFLYS